MKSGDVSSMTSSKAIVCVYTQNDESFYRELQTCLSLWQREKYIQWLEIPAGSDRERTMQAHLQQADLILLLISPDFFAKDYCYSAMKTSLQEHARRQMPVVPILARASAWKESACGGLHPLPADEQPIAQWTYPEQAYEEIRFGLVRLLSGDDKYREKLMRKTVCLDAKLVATQENGAIAQSNNLHIENTASNQGQQGIFNAPINNSYH